MEKKERNTNQKKIIISYLEKNKNKHLTINQIYTELKKEIGQTTIYRIINKLIDKGFVSKIPLENAQGFCYQYNKKNCRECANHYHLICENCGKLLHFNTNEIEKIQKEALQNEDFNIDTNKITFYGECKKCKEKNIK